MIHTSEITWREIVSLEPEAARIVSEAAAIRGPEWRDYSRLKLQLSRLVGFGARKPQLRSCRAYEVALDRLVEAIRL